MSAVFEFNKSYWFVTTMYFKIFFLALCNTL